MGNTQSSLKYHFYITKVTNLDLPLVPFVHLITGYNNMPIGDISPLALKEILKSQDLTLDILDLVLNQTFKITIPKFNCQGTPLNSNETQEERSHSSQQEPRLGINVVKIKELPILLKMQVISIKESSNTKLEVNDNILGVEGEYCEDEDSLIGEIKENANIKLVAVRKGEVITVDVEDSEIGCELGMGILYSIKKEEIFMKGYTGKIRKSHTVQSAYESLGSLGSESIEESLSSLEVSERLNEKGNSNDKYEAISSIDNEKNKSTMSILSNLSENTSQSVGNTLPVDSSLSENVAQSVDNTLSENAVQSVGNTLPVDSSLSSLLSENTAQSVETLLPSSLSNQPSGNASQTEKEALQQTNEKSQDKNYELESNSICQSSLKELESNSMSNFTNKNVQNSKSSIDLSNFSELSITSSTQSEPFLSQGTHSSTNIASTHNLSETDLSFLAESIVKTSEEQLNSNKDNIDHLDNKSYDDSSQNKNASLMSKVDASNQADQKLIMNALNQNQLPIDVNIQADQRITENSSELSNEHKPIGALPIQPGNAKSSSYNLEKRTGSYVYRSPRSSKDNTKSTINEPIDNSQRIYKEAQVPPENIFLQGQNNKETTLKTQDTIETNGASLVSGEDYNSEGRIKDEVYEKNKKAEFENLNKLFEEEDDTSLPFDSPKNSTAL